MSEAIDESKKDILIKMQNCAYEKIDIDKTSPVYRIFKMRKTICQELLKEGSGVFEHDAIQFFNLYNESIKAYFNI